ncbi:hypothetical protein OSB04_024478 [Centaurea solstitialis]|uniref:Transposase-associated domain-containing protein n=1 Tax=Centaurea solstitialis TaxID=347529 RepID=A0AA38SZJ3_9ASTR|nr:hypothetical protein OSB04_024478 [Centaurea solstitialis]
MFGTLSENVTLVSRYLVTLAQMISCATSSSTSHMFGTSSANVMAKVTLTSLSLIVFILGEFILPRIWTSRGCTVCRTRNRKYELGVNEFLKFAYRGKDESSKIPCPCKKCNNFRNHDKSTVFSHLMQMRISLSYDKWIYHGESFDVSDDNDDDIPYDEDNGDDDINNDDLDEMLNNIGQSTLDKDLETLDRLSDELHQELYKECQSYSKFSFVVTILHLKTTSGWSIKSFGVLLDIFRKALPTPASISKDFYEAKKYIRELGFKGEKIHACMNDCILYRNEYASHTECLNVECKEPRYSENDSKVPRKVLRYFPLKPRLQRLFIDGQVARDMRWHNEKRVNDANIARHPADSEAWKHLDECFLYSPKIHAIIWPVFVVPYNLPPWECMKDPYLFMSMLIPGPKSPGINIDVYLQPLIDELNELWFGVTAYDADKKERFLLRATLLWTINDFPAYDMLSGWSMGHRRFLPSSNQWRKDKKSFDGRVDMREPIIPKSGLEFLHDIDDCNISEPYCFTNRKKQSLVATLFNIKGKTKDTCKSRKDLMDQGLKKSLHLQPNAKIAGPPQYRWMFSFESEHKIELERESYNDVNERHDKQFASWLGLRVNNCQQAFASEIRILSRGPLSFVNKFSGCMVNGYRFHTQSREKDRKTQNSGVVVRGDQGENVIDFYGILEEVLEVECLGENKRVLVFKCECFRVGDAKGLQINKESGGASVNMSRKCCTPRTSYDVPLKEVYQEEEPQWNGVVDFNMDQSSLTRGNVPLELVDDSLVMDERFIDDDEIDPIDLEFSQKEDSWEDSTDSN